MSTINLKKSKKYEPTHNVVLCDMLPTKNHKLVLRSFSWENLHTYELSPTRFHRVQGDEVGILSVFEKFKKNKKKSTNIYFKKIWRLIQKIVRLRFYTI